MRTSDRLPEFQKTRNIISASRLEHHCKSVYSSI